MKSVPPSAIALGVIVFSAAGAQAHGFHKDCQYGPPAAKGWPTPKWHRHGLQYGAPHFYSCEAPKGGKVVDKTKPVVAPRCAARPRASSSCPPHSAEWTCANWYTPLRCCTSWQCTSKVR
jgi:hypothetical protein